MKQTIALFLLCASLAPAATRGWQPGESSAREARFRLSAGHNHACVVPYDGTVRCWGRNESGQLGNGTTANSTTPVTVLVKTGFLLRPLTGVVAVAAGGNSFTCALTATGKVFCWGRDVIGQLGNGVFNDALPQPFATPVTAFTNAVRISAGINGACALLADGTVRCWGDQAFTAFPGPTVVTGLSSVTDISSGFHSCVLQTGGGGSCFGTSNDFGQLGNGQAPGGASLGPIVNLADATVIASSDHASCAVSSQGQIRCWGSNASGELGIGISAAPFLDSPSTPVFQINDAVSVDGGGDRFCALTAAGLVKCWGLGTLDGLPFQLAGRSQIIAISVGRASGICTLSADGTVACNGAFLSGNFPGLAGSVSAKAIATGSHSCAVRANGTVACWGENGADAALLGNGTGPAVVPNPTAVNGLTNVTAVTVGVEHSCVLIADGSVKCWGRNSRGQIGNSTAVDQPLPVPVPNVQGVVAIQAGSFHTCAIQVNGNTFCWGANESGQLAIQADTGDRRQPNLVLTNNIVSLAAGRAHTCAVRSDANLFCWGAGAFGQIGNGGATPINTVAVQVPGFTNALAVSSGAGADHSCAADGTGALRCWGRNDRGQIGLGAAGGNVLAPTVVPGLPASAYMTAPGTSHTCAARTDGFLSCWGANLFGQLGLGSVTFRNQPAPVDVPGARVVSAVAAGLNTTCALSPTGGLDCWGDNNAGQVGDGTSGNQQPVPTAVPSFTLNIIPTVAQSASNPRKLTVNIIANCEEGAQLKLSVQVRQATGAAGQGNETVRCTGQMSAFPVDIQAQGGTPFAAGAATVEAEAEIRGDRGERTTQSWTRAVTIVR